VALGAAGADAVTVFERSVIAEDVAAAHGGVVGAHPLWAVVGPSTAFGREVLGRLAAVLGAGLVGDAIALSIVEGELVAAKPAFSGAMVADITCTFRVRWCRSDPGYCRCCRRAHHTSGP
jgi:electron transfer flavoprotein alpha subunit